MQPDELRKLGVDWVRARLWPPKAIPTPFPPDPRFIIVVDDDLRRTFAPKALVLKDGSAEARETTGFK